MSGTCKRCGYPFDGAGVLRCVCPDDVRDTEPPDPRNDWLNGWPRKGPHVLIVTSLRCAGCGQYQGTLAVAIPADAEFPDKEPDWPFPENDCPVHNEPRSKLLELATTALADIALSEDLDEDGRRAKALRVHHDIRKEWFGPEGKK
jgi:hypothetical protein